MSARAASSTTWRLKEPRGERERMVEVNNAGTEPCLKDRCSSSCRVGLSKSGAATVPHFSRGSARTARAPGRLAYGWRRTYGRMPNADRWHPPCQGLTEMPRFLVVDDDPSAVTGMTQLLTGDGHEVAPFTGGADAVDALSREPFDAIVTDLEMPHVDGHAVVRAATTTGVDCSRITAFTRPRRWRRSVATVVARSVGGVRFEAGLAA